MGQPQENLYTLGWRQGSVFDQDLQVCVNRLSQSGVRGELTTHSKWIVASQDCDLAGCDLNSTTEIEVWPLHSTEEVVAASIRNKKFGVLEGLMLTSPAARAYVEARALARFEKSAAGPNERACRRFKTWLGRRYDRPAIPKEYENAARTIASAVKSLRDRTTERLVRDVLMVFIAEAPFVVEIFAVISEDSKNEMPQVELWLSSIAQKIGGKVPLRKWSAVPESLTSLLVLEHSYSADLSQLTIDDEEQLQEKGD